MIFRVLLFSSLFAIVFAQGCCVPSQWEGYKHVSGTFSKWFGKPKLTDDVFVLSYDAINQQIAVLGNVTKDKIVSEFKVIYNFTSGVGYMIYTEAQTCKAFNLTKDFEEACIPASATYEGSAFIGAGESKLELTSYKLSIKKLLNRLAAYITVTTTDCLPVDIELTGHYNKYFFTKEVHFRDITSGIKDPTVFSPPMICDEGVVEVIDDEEHEIHNVLNI